MSVVLPLFVRSGLSRSGSRWYRLLRLVIQSVAMLTPGICVWAVVAGTGQSGLLLLEAWLVEQAAVGLAVVGLSGHTLITLSHAVPILVLGLMIVPCALLAWQLWWRQAVSVATSGQCNDHDDDNYHDNYNVAASSSSNKQKTE
jgi:hypothetical protein